MKRDGESSRIIVGEGLAGSLDEREREREIV